RRRDRGARPYRTVVRQSAAPLYAASASRQSRSGPRRAGRAPARGRRMTKLAIIADDLSGALDAAAPLAMRGLRTIVALAPAGIETALRDDPEIIGVSTGSREGDPSAARAAVRRCLEALPAGTRIFKKVDSRLKGNIEAELDAIPYQRSLVVPAIPAFGRWVRDGRLGGFGVAEPVSVAARLGAHGSRASIPDIERQSDIDAALEATPCDLLVGARGLAEAVALRLAPS